MADIKFGVAQVNNPTPKGLKLAFRIFSFINGAIAIVLTMLPGIPEHLKYQIVTGMTIGTTLMHYTIKFFGLTDTGMEDIGI